MKIALLGYGKMGKTLESLAHQKQHQIVYKTNQTPEVEQLVQADVAIEFSVPEAAFSNITTCFKKGIPVVSGTTGWLARLDEALTLCKQYNGSFIYASNFSIGVNIFFELNRKLAELMNSHPEYQVAIEEIHHTQKLDAPSGTAVSLAEQIIENSSYREWKLQNFPEESMEATQLPITALRREDVKGTHTVSYQSSIDTLSIKHEAHSREGFALGALLAAEWLQDKKGIYSMKNVLGIG